MPTQHGWYVGYVEKAGQVWFFAANLVIKQESDVASRRRSR
jgi:beta-lactamase class D